MENQINTNVPLNTPPIEPPKKIWFLRHEFLYSVIGVLLLVVIAGSVYWWKAQKEEVENLKQVNENVDNVNSQTGLQIYKSAKFNFEFKYPSGWTAANESVLASQDTSAGENIMLEPITKNNSDYYPTIGLYYSEIENRFITGFGNSESIKIDRYDGSIEKVFSKESEYAPDNIDPNRIDYIDAFVRRGRGSLESRLQILPSKGEVFLLTYIPPRNPTPEEEKIFHDLLSSVKFISDVVGESNVDAQIRDEDKIRAYEDMQAALQFAYTDNDMKWPDNLLQVEKKYMALNTLPRYSLETNEKPPSRTGHTLPIDVFSYSVRPDKKVLHLGITLETTVQVDSNSDGDFNSTEAKWTTGFDGADNKKCKNSDTGTWCYDFRMDNAIEVIDP